MIRRTVRNWVDAGRDNVTSVSPGAFEGRSASRQGTRKPNDSGTTLSNHRRNLGSAFVLGLRVAVGSRGLGIPLLLLCPLALSSAAAHAQSAFGNLAGQVTDSSGAVISGAAINAKNIATGQTFNSVSTSSGSFRFGDVPLGRYDVTVSAPGFSTTTSNGADVTINSTTALNIALTAGEVSTNVTVDASAPALQTETSDINGTVGTKQIIELPLALGGVGAMRSPEAFVFLLPGTTGPGTGSNNDNGLFLSKIGGGQSFGNEVLLDGVSQQRSENGSSFDEEAPSVEALQEFKVTTATPSAEYGRTGGGIESFVTKQGTSTYHGTIYMLAKNDVLDANTWFNNGYKAQNCVGAANTGACRELYNVPGDKKYDYGGTFGGPIRIPHVYDGKNKSFFFYSWEQFQQKLGGTPVTTLPSAAERTGDFSAILGGPALTSVKGVSTTTTNPCTGQLVLQNQIFDPATARTVGGTPCRTPFPNNVIPTTRLSPAAQKLASYLPQTNLPGQAGLYGQVNNFAYNGRYSINNTTETIRGDQVISQNDRVFGSYSVRENNRYTGQPTLPFPIDSGGDQQDFTTHFGRGGYDHTFSANLLNHFLVGLNRSNSINFASALIAPTKVNYSAQSGIGNINSNAFPIVTWDGLDGFDNLGRGEDGDNFDNALIFHDGLDWQKGRHSLTIGGEFRKQQFSVIDQTTPQLHFVRSETDVSTVVPNGSPQQISGNSYASFLLGAPDSASQNVQLHAPRWNSQYFALYIQDNVKVSNQLTLNLGVQYSVDFPRTESENQTSNFSLTAPDPAANNLPGAYVFATNFKSKQAWANTYYKDISPRIGFAYTPAQSQGKTVFRGAFDILYAPLQYTDFGGGMQQGYDANPNPASPDGFTPAFQLDSGFPAFARTQNLDPGQLTGTTGNFNNVPNNTITPGMGRPAQVYNWSFQMQQQVAEDLIFTIGYIGQAAQNLRSSLENINNIPLADLAMGNKLTDNIPVGGAADGIAAPYPTFSGQVQRALRPFPQYDFIATDCCLQNVGHSSYEALIASLARQFRNGLNLQISYTWAKNLTDADSILPNTNAGVAQDQNVFNHRLEKSVSTQNIPHTFVASYLYELPVGKGKAFLNRGGITNFALGGWQIGGIQRYQSGQPMSFGGASGIPGYQNLIRYSRNPSQPLANPAYQANKHKANLFSGISYFNPLAFVDPNANRNGGAYQLGSGIPRVTEEVTSPLWLTEDFSLIKNFPIKENTFFQLKVEALDAFNRHNFSIPDQAPQDGAGRFGVATVQDYGPRNLQITGRISF